MWEIGALHRARGAIVRDGGDRNQIRGRARCTPLTRCGRHGSSVPTIWPEEFICLPGSPGGLETLRCIREIGVVADDPSEEIPGCRKITRTFVERR